MIIIVGLGNPGEKYEKTRHNLGFVVLDALLQELTRVEKTEWERNKKFNCLLAKIDELLLAKPQTFMNASGFAVAKMARFYKIKPEDIWVIHDEVDLPLGKIRIVHGRGAAGHRGVASIIKELGTTDFVRFRLGIGHPGPGSSDKEMEDYVLSSFDRGEKSKVRKMVKKAAKVIQLSLREGLERGKHQVQP